MAKRDIEFLSDGLKIRGVLQIPQGKGPFPIVILGHGLSGLKEWTLPEVGEALVQVGIAGMWFDYRNFGDSEGKPRDDSPEMISDVRDHVIMDRPPASS